jgi:outer membrane protein assembly factor BamD (BamD/ComL family)
MKIRFFLLIPLAALSSCVTGPVDIPADMPPGKIIQKAQEATDTNKYKIALQYYEALLERYGDSEEYLCTAEYEFAFIRYKQKKYTEARERLEVLLDRYEEPGGESLPPQFRVLAEKVLARITERGH